MRQVVVERLEISPWTWPVSCTSERYCTILNTMETSIALLDKGLDTAAYILVPSTAC